MCHVLSAAQADLILVVADFASPAPSELGAAEKASGRVLFFYMPACPGYTFFYTSTGHFWYMSAQGPRGSCPVDSVPAGEKMCATSPPRPKAVLWSPHAGSGRNRRQNHLLLHAPPRLDRYS